MDIKKEKEFKQDGKCCYCNDACNPASQSCGSCSRGISGVAIGIQAPEHLKEYTTLYSNKSTNKILIILAEDRGRAKLQTIEMDTLAQSKRIVGGYIQIIPHSRLTIYVNEDGFGNLPLNYFLSDLFKINVFGNAVITLSDEHGNDIGFEPTQTIKDVIRLLRDI